MHHLYRLRPLTGLLAVTLVLALLGGCAFSGGGSGEGGDKSITLVTHDSWAMDKKVLARFREETGYRIRQVSSGDAGELTNKLVLTKDDPIGDVAYGIDNAFSSRATDAGVIDGRLAPIDYGDVCMNVDDRWFARHHLAPPATLDDLTRPRYRGLLVVPGATTSSPGLAFLLTTIAAKGDAWPAYWKRLLANQTKVVAGWSEAYETDFTAGGGDGRYPIVLSYASSIPFTVPEGGTKPTTSALLDTCYRQVEYAGVLRGTDHPALARKLVAFLRSAAFQRALPEQMYVYPAVEGTPLPADWSKFAKVAEKPWRVDPAEVEKNRSAWLREWRDLVTG